MDQLIKQGELLLKEIEKNQKKIKNTVLYHSTISALELFIQNVDNNEE